MNSKSILIGNNFNAAAFLCLIAVVEVVIFYAFDLIGFMLDMGGVIFLKPLLYPLIAVSVMLVLAPMKLGFIKWITNLSEDKYTLPFDVFAMYDADMFKYLKIKLIVHLQCLAFAVTALLPWGAAGEFKEYLLIENSYAVYYCLRFFLFAVALVALIMFCYRYLPVSLIYLQKEDMSARQIIKESFSASRSTMYDFCVMTGKFLPKFLMCIFIVPAFFVIPQYVTEVVVFFNRQIKKTA